MISALAARWHRQAGVGRGLGRRSRCASLHLACSLGLKQRARSGLLPTGPLDGTVTPRGSLCRQCGRQCSGCNSGSGAGDQSRYGWGLIDVAQAQADAAG